MDGLLTMTLDNDGLVTHETVHLFGPNYAQVCFGVDSINPKNTGWIGIWALYATGVQYLPILISLGFIFVGFVSKSTLIHFISNTIQFSWLLNICLEYKFRVHPIERECIVSVKVADIQLLGPVFALPPVEVTQSVALTIFFTFYLLFWKRNWFNYVEKNGFFMETRTSELQEKTWLIVIFILLLIQNPLLLLIRNVYSLTTIIIGFFLGILASMNIIMVYLFLMYMCQSNIPYKEDVLEAVAKTSTNFPIDNPFYLLTPILMPLD